MLLLKQNTTSKVQVDENIIKLNISNNSGEYKLKAIQNSVIYT